MNRSRCDCKASTPPERKQPFGERARQALAELTFQKEAELRCNKTDRYKRQVCSVWVTPASAPNGQRILDAGLAMVTQGMAWWYRAHSREQSPQERGQYEFTEREAAAHKVGLWRDSSPIAPWDWRKNAREAQQRLRQKSTQCGL